MKFNLIEDLSTLTTIDESTLNKLSSKVVWCICDSLEKTMLSGDTKAEIDCGFGTLKIVVEESSIKYRFEPNVHLKKSVTNLIVNEQNCLVESLEESLVNKVESTYKNFF